MIRLYDNQHIAHSIEGPGTLGRIRLVAFDVDGTLIRGDTVCEALARSLGQIRRMQEFERLSVTEIDAIISARQEMATWYQSVPLGELCSCLECLEFAPGAREGIELLKEHDIQIALVSLTWEFAVAWIAASLGVDHYVGSTLSPEGEISHFWPQDKHRWLAERARQLGVELGDVAAVGDSLGDVEMLRLVGHPFFVGSIKPDVLANVPHFPDGDIHTIAQHIVLSDSLSPASD